MQLPIVAEFSAEIRKCLVAWGVPDSADTSYDRSEGDIIHGGQLRSANGKGLRSVLHAAFTVGLAQYCIDRDLPHPGFVILDSPIVTYRPPDFEGDGDARDVPPELAAAFYDDLQSRFLGQVIVMENVDPPLPLVGDALDATFTKNATVGRYGYFRAPTDENPERAAHASQ